MLYAVINNTAGSCWMCSCWKFDIDPKQWPEHNLAKFDEQQRANKCNNRAAVTVVISTCAAFGVPLLLKHNQHSHLKVSIDHQRWTSYCSILTWSSLFKEVKFETNTIIYSSMYQTMVLLIILLIQIPSKRNFNKASNINKCWYKFASSIKERKCLLHFH